MSAELLRRAAAKLRERADWFGTTSPWKVEHPADGYPQRIVDDGAVLYAETYDGTRGTPQEAGTAEYIALMGPPVALALADWLDLYARLAAKGYSVADEAVAVARAVLRESTGTHPEAPVGDLATFIDNMRLLRLGRRIQQQDLAAQLGLKQNVLSTYEQHKHTPDTETLTRWADALGVEMPDGMTGRIDPVAQCGTISGRTTHRRRGEPPCDDCKRAWAAYMRERNRRRRPTGEVRSG